MKNLSFHLKIFGKWYHWLFLRKSWFREIYLEKSLSLCCHKMPFFTADKPLVRSCSDLEQYWAWNSDGFEKIFFMVTFSLLWNCLGSGCSLVTGPYNFLEYGPSSSRNISKGVFRPLSLWDVSELLSKFSLFPKN